jgi:transposase
MGLKRRRFTREFKLEAVRMAQQPDAVNSEVAKDLGISVESLYRWTHTVEADQEQAFPGQGNIKADTRELVQLRRQVKRLESENAFLKKVSAFFAKENK